MVRAGDAVIYNPGDGRTAVEGLVDAVNSDGTVDLRYPHPNAAAAAAGVMATAGKVKRGTSVYQFQADDGESAAPVREVAAAPSIDSRLDALSKRVDDLEQALGSHSHQLQPHEHKSVADALEALRADVDALKAPAPVAEAGKKPAAGKAKE